MIVEINLPINVRVENVGTIFLSENVITSNRTKHVDTRYRFVNEFVEDRFIEIIFVKTKNHVADIFKKSTSGEIGDRHHNKMVKYIETKQERCYKVFNLIYRWRTDKLTDKENKQTHGWTNRKTNRQREHTNERTKESQPNHENS